MQVSHRLALLLLTFLLACSPKAPGDETSSRGPSPSPFPSAPQASPTETVLLQGDWMIEYEVTTAPGTSWSNGQRLRVRSTGERDQTSWQNGVAGPQPKTVQRRITEKSLAELAGVLSDPELKTAPATPSDRPTPTFRTPTPVPDSPNPDPLRVRAEGPPTRVDPEEHRLSLTVNGQTVTATSFDGVFPGAWGRAKAALESVETPAVPAAAKSFSVSYLQPASPDTPGRWRSRELLIDGTGQAQSIYAQSALESDWNFLEGQLETAQVEKLGAWVEGFTFPDEPNSGQGNYALIVRAGSATHVFFSEDGTFPEPASDLKKLLDELYPGGLNSQPWRPDPAPISEPQ